MFFSRYDIIRNGSDTAIVLAVSGEHVLCQINTDLSGDPKLINPKDWKAVGNLENKATRAIGNITDLVNGVTQPTFSVQVKRRRLLKELCFMHLLLCSYNADCKVVVRMLDSLLRLEQDHELDTKELSTWYNNAQSPATKTFMLKCKSSALTTNFISISLYKDDLGVQVNEIKPIYGDNGSFGCITKSMAAVC